MMIKLLNFTPDFLIIKHSLPHFNILNLNCNIHYWRGPKFVKASGSYTTMKPGKKRSLSLLDEYFFSAYTAESWFIC